MATPDDMIIELPADDIQMGIDPDGLPRTDPVIRTAADKPDIKPVADVIDIAPEPKVKAKKPDVDVAEVQRRAEQAEARRDEALRLVETEREARLSAERDRGKITQQANTDYWGRINAEFEHVNSALSFVTTEQENAKAALKAAIEAADAEAQTVAQDRLAEAKVNLSTLKAGKERIAGEIHRAKSAFEAEAAAPREPKSEPEKPAAKPAQTADDYIAAVPHKAVGEWLKDHKDYVTDPSKHQRFLAFANYYVAENGANSLGSQDFVDALSEKYDPQPKDDPVGDEVEDKPAPKAKAKSMPSAPVSRNSDFVSSRNLNGNKIKLPPKMADFVRTSGLNAQAYGEEMVALIKAGKLPKNYLDADYPHEF